MSQKYKKASFRGVEFFVSESQGQFGRRNILWEFPLRDKPASEDIGRKAQVFTIEAYVLGEDFQSERDALIAAIETEGPGILVHPYYGRKTVIVQACSVSESKGETFYCKFSLTFAEAGEIKTPLGTEDALSQVGGAADVLSAAAEGDFSSTFSVLGAPAYVVKSAQKKLNDIANKIESVRGSASAFYNNAAELSFALRNLRTAAVDLLNSPKDLAKKISSAIALLSATYKDVTGDLVKAQKELFNFGSDDKAIVHSTSTRYLEDRNRIALNDLVRRTALAQAATGAVKAQYTSKQEGEATRDELLVQMDTTEATAPDEVYDAIQSLRTKVAKHVPAVSAGLPSVASYAPARATNALVLSHTLYNSLDLATDLSTRNDLRHPGFISGGKTLEVLTNA